MMDGGTRPPYDEQARWRHEDASTEESTPGESGKSEGSNKKSWSSEGSEENKPRTIKLRTHIRAPKKCSDEKEMGAALIPKSSKF